MKRVILIVLDSLGIGYAPDAQAFDDEGANTLASVMAEQPSLINLRKLGLGNIDKTPYMEEDGAPIGIYGALEEISAGKDTTIGHWEMAGLEIDRPFPTYPQGFPEEVIKAFESKTGLKALCNQPYSGTEVIKDYAREHFETGNPIVYTSNDSVFQIAAHEEIIPLARLYEICRIAREILVGDHAVARVIARPFIGQEGNFTRTSNRRDFSVKPFDRTVLDDMRDQGLEVIGVGKIGDIFAGVGISEEIPTVSNMDGVDRVLEVMEKDFSGLIFANLVDFDANFGHRRNPKGYAQALEDFDRRLPEIISSLRDGDLLMITADHGNDPSFRGTDHTRERVPLLLYKTGISPRNLGTLRGFYNISASLYDYFGVKGPYLGESVL